MAQGRKYANLPDLDSAPDVYETVERGDNAPAAAQSPTSGQSSPNEGTTSSSASDSDEGGETRAVKSSRVDRHANRPARARDHFAGSRVDARGVDFSDRIGGRKSYRVLPTRRKRRVGRERGGYEEEYGDFSDEDEQETFESRLARLKRELQEVKEEGNRRVQQSATENGEQREAADGLDDIAELEQVLSALQVHSRSGQGGTRKPLASTSLPKRTAPTNGDSQNAQPNSSQEFSTEDLNRILTKAASFENRLTELEDALGASATTTQSQNSANKDIFTTLSTLEAQFGFLSNTNAPSLETLERQIHQLTEDATRLSEARKAAHRAQEALASKSLSRPGSAAGGAAAARPSSASEHLPRDVELSSKINALFNNIPTIEAMAPLLPSVLERLKSLRVLHTDAAVASENLAQVEKRQGVVGDELKKWRQGLETMEKALQQGQEAGERSETTVERWVKDLEARIQKLES